jgi:SAM-dependent methyltransferase
MAGVENDPHPPGDPYSRADYRRLIAWSARLARERPFLLHLLDRAPERSVLDVGCGTGEHVAFFAEAGARAVGLDASESMIEAAREHEARGHGRFVLGDAREARSLLTGEAPFGLALCLGNMLPHLLAEEDALRLFAEVHALLRPRGEFLVQVVNYERILAEGVRALPVNVRQGGDGGEIVFLRLLKPAPAGRILFFPTTLVLDPDAEQPVSVKQSRRVELRAWRAPEIGDLLGRTGFEVVLHGDMAGGPYEPRTSTDVVVVATAR